MEPFNIDDSHQRPSSSSSSSLYLVARPFLSIFAFPLHILSNVFRFIFGILRIPIPQFRFASLGFYRPLPRGPRHTHRGGPDRWVRELEEETGAVCIGSTKGPRGVSTATEGAGPSTLTSRPRTAEDGGKMLPDFTLGSYDEVLRTCQQEARIACIVLVSEEHDDVAEFKRSTLTDPTFVKLLYDNNVIVWGGDVRDQDAWSAAEKLQATTYPFVAFLALQPRRSPNGSSSRSASSQPPSLTILSRHQGPCTSSISTPTPTSAQSLTHHLTHQLLPRVTPFLERIHALHRERDRDRQLREEQDRAFRDTARRDKERIESKMAEERREQERNRMMTEERQRKLNEADERRRKEQVRMQWRRWARKNGAGAGVEGQVRIAVRLPDGGRVVKMLEETTTLTALYLLVDTHLIPTELSMQDDPSSPPEEGCEAVGVEAAIEMQIAAEDRNGDDWWGFRLALAYPRMVVPWEKGRRIGQVESLRGGAQVVVEMLGTAGVNDIDNSGDDDDGYHTEDSE